MTEKENFLIPCGSRIVVKEDSFKYAGMIVIPEVSKRRPTTGVVVSVGPDVPYTQDDVPPTTEKRPTIEELEKILKEENKDVKFSPNGEVRVERRIFEAGDRVLYAQFSGTLVEFRGHPAYRVLSTDEILAKISPDVELEGTAA